MSGGLILLYHRVADLALDPQWLAVSPKHFGEHLEVLRRHWTPVAMRSLVRGLQSNELPERAVAITFDDGYWDNAAIASPLLHKLDVPATVFCTSAHTGTADEFFWDELGEILLSPGKLPQKLLLDAPASISIELAEDSVLTEQQAANFSHWNVTQGDDPTRRHMAYRVLSDLMYRSNIDERGAAMAQLRTWARRNHTTDRNRMMSAEELRGIAADGLIDIGGHTVDHPRLSSESAQTQREQIINNRSTLETIAGRPITGFSYPFGTRHDFTPVTTEIVRKAGLEFACANFAGLASPQSDRLRLPRFIVRDWPGDEFERRLTAWQAGDQSTNTYLDIAPAKPLVECASTANSASRLSAQQRCGG